jgi:hypothetical protein
MDLRLVSGKRTVAIEEIPYREAACFCRAYHRYLPEPPPRQQIAKCYAIGGRGIHAVAMLGNPVSPWFSRSDFELRRMISDGKLHGGVSALYRHSAAFSHLNGRDMVTYTFNSCPISVLAAGGIFEGARKPGKDTRKGRQNLTSALVKYRWRWYAPR